jgi:hypothetical protein
MIVLVLVCSNHCRFVALGTALEIWWYSIGYKASEAEVELLNRMDGAESWELAHLLQQ